MEDKIQEVIEQYDIEVNQVMRARGGRLLESNQGLLLLQTGLSSERRLELENQMKEHLVESGYRHVDICLKNREGNYLTQDRYGEMYTVRKWFQGEEINLKSGKEVLLASKNLALLHKKLTGVSLEMRENEGEDFPEQLKRHNCELKRVYSYILGKNRKNEFETMYLSMYPYFYQQAADAVEALMNSGYHHLLEEAVSKKMVVHGSYNQHKVLQLSAGELATIDFSKARTGLQILDVYHFLRKTMEKNQWDMEMAELVISGYEEEKTIAKEEKEILYCLFLYPEKFHKAANYYFNTRKSWVSARTLQKLKEVEEQKTEKSRFLQKFHKWVII